MLNAIFFDWQNKEMSKDVFSSKLSKTAGFDMFNRSNCNGLQKVCIKRVRLRD